MQWGSGDNWRCSIALPAGSKIQCKYVVVNDSGAPLRWQEGSNMELSVPATCSGQPVRQYDVNISWCKSFVHNTATVDADGFSSPVATPLASPVSHPIFMITDDAPEPEVRAVEPAPVSAHSSVALRAAQSAAAQPLAAWALARGAAALEPIAATPLAAATQAVTEVAQPVAPVTAAAFATLQAQRKEQQQQQQGTVADPKQAREAAAAPTHASAAAALSSSIPAAIGMAAAVMQAASQAMREPAARPAAPAPASARSRALPFQLTPPSADAPMSIVLPPRSSSPPVTISLSSNFSQLMDMPASVSACRTGAASGGGAASSSASPATPIIKTSSCAPAAANAASASSSSSSVSAAAQPGQRSSSLPDSRVGQPQPASRAAAAGTAPASASATPAGVPADALLPSSAAWGQEYDMYSSVYDTGYMHTAFDLDVYAMYDQVGPEPASAASPSALRQPLPVLGSLGPSGGDPIGSGCDLLESAVQAACAKPAAASNAAPPAPAAAAPRPAASLGDWAGRALFELCASRDADTDSLDSYEDLEADLLEPVAPSAGPSSEANVAAADEADVEDMVADALAAPVDGPAMTALLQQLGSALGRSVRLRCDGADAAAVDVLELDRTIALAASKLYRKRDNILTGFVRKETRRQLAAAAAGSPGARPQISKSVTPL